MCDTDFNSGITLIGTEQTFSVSHPEVVEAIAWTRLLELLLEEFLRDVKISSYAEGSKYSPVVLSRTKSSDGDVSLAATARVRVVVYGRPTS